MRIERFIGLAKNNNLHAEKLKRECMGKRKNVFAEKSSLAGA